MGPEQSSNGSPSLAELSFCSLQGGVCCHRCFCSVIPDNCSFSWQFWGGSLGTALCKCSMTLGWSVELGRSALLPFWSYHKLHRAVRAKGDKSSTDKFLMPLKLRIPINFGTFTSVHFFPKTFPEDVFMKLVFSITY